MAFIGDFDKKSPWPMAEIGTLDPARPSIPLGLWEPGDKSVKFCHI
jgi:hypothetical protein